MRHRVVHHAASKVSHVCTVTIKVAVTILVLMVGLIGVLRYMGMPVPSAEQLLRDATRIL
jgi:hypothetical protein